MPPDAQSVANPGSKPGARDFELVAGWIARNAEALIDYWNGTLSTVEFTQHIEKLAG